MGEFGKYFKNSWNIKILWTFIVDIVLYVLTYGTMLLFAKVISNKYRGVERAVEVFDQVSESYAASLVDLMRGTLIQGLGLFVVMLLVIFCYWVLFKGYIYSQLTGRKLTKDFFKKYLIYNLMVFGVLIFPALFIIFFMMVFAELNFLSFAFFLSLILTLVLSYFFMLSNIIFVKKLRYKSIWEGFSLGIRVKKTGLPFLILLLFIYLGNFIWVGLAKKFLFSENVYFIGLSLILLFIVSWFRFFNVVLVKRWLK